MSFPLPVPEEVDFPIPLPPNVCVSGACDGKHPVVLGAVHSTCPRVGESSRPSAERYGPSSLQHDASQRSDQREHPALRSEFWPAPKWLGPSDARVFKLGPRDLGYYVDWHGLGFPFQVHGGSQQRRPQSKQADFEPTLLPWLLPPTVTVGRWHHNVRRTMPLAECACQPDVWAYDPPTTGHIPLPWWHHAQWQVAREAGYKPAVVHGPSPYPSDYGHTMDMPASMDDLTVDGAGMSIVWP